MSLWTTLNTVPHRLDMVDVDGVPTRVLRAGSGEPVIFLHGISGHLEAFIRTLPAHVEAGYEVHLIDMLGQGYTGKPDYDYTIDRIAEHVLGYMDSQGLESANLVGISLGGWVAGWMLLNHPTRIRRATLTLAAGSPSMHTPELMERISKSTRAAVEQSDREFTRKRLEQVMYNKELVDDEIVDVRYRIYHQPEFQQRLDHLLALTDSETAGKYMLPAQDLQNVQNEVLLVWSEEDAYDTVSGANHFSENLPHNKLVIFKDAGHWPPYERPETFAEINTAFLRNGLSAVQAGSV